MEITGGKTVTLQEWTKLMEVRRIELLNKVKETRECFIQLSLAFLKYLFNCLASSGRIVLFEVFKLFLFF